MLKIITEPVTLQPKTPKENEELCSHCNGIGWLQGEGYIEQCRICYGRGVLNLCPDCHKPIRGMCMESECSSKKDGLITIKGKEYPIKLMDGYYIIRKLTVTECKRLQTVPEWYEFPVSDTQAYKMLGNGWSVDVIVHLIEATLREDVDI